MKIAVLVGSLRSDSYNKFLAENMQKRYQSEHELEILEIGDLPFYNQDDELDPPEVVKNFKRQVADADGVMIITPEYNWSVPGVLKNALDWLSRVDKVLIDKPVMTAGASPTALGTVRAQLHLRQILSAPGVSARVLPPGGNEVLINFASEKFDQSGRLIDESTLEFLDRIMEKFAAWIKK
ncbi:NADPH-dependent FMN reductase [Ornithinibacillus halophilus]|uniref:NAD(P)H-dependent FMN reductase n=1 Tax=Ornithinibacillus halophilus TaxID=930117 RepID=A0A1M5NDQ6_9BACI|nr:NADPH-dependent FMN reductase [Ornithinibacillus halophilus]SHG87746.1 NAD(P)H-dependent FMN reductase [Ornithinibacillus halophilus]